MSTSVHLPLRIFSFVFIAASCLAQAQTARSRERVVELFQQAQAAEQTEDFSKVETLYREILELDPQIAEVWSNLGMDFYRMKNDSEAVSAFEHAVSLKPSLLAPHLFEGKAYLNLNEAQKAIAPLNAALKLDPNQPDAILALSDAYFDTRQYSRSIDLLQGAQAKNSDLEDIDSRLAIAYLDWAKDLGVAIRQSHTVYGQILFAEGGVIERQDEREARFRDLVKSEPSSVEARLKLASFLMEGQGSASDLSSAREQIDAARRIAPDDPAIGETEVRLLVEQRMLGEASSTIEKMITNDLDFVSANFDDLTAGLSPDERARLHRLIGPTAGIAGKGWYSSRVAHLERTKRQRPLTVAEAAELGSAAWHLHQFDLAFLVLSANSRTSPEAEYWLFRTCVELGERVLANTVIAHPDSVRSHLLMADFAVQQDNYQSAKIEYEAALALRPDDPEILLLYVRVLETARETDKALEQAMRGADRFPHHAGLNLEVGDIVLTTGGDPSIAINYLERSVSADPTPVKPHVDLAKAYAHKQRTNDAISEINKVIKFDKDGAMHYQLARWYNQTGRRIEAAEALEVSKRLKQSSFKDEQRGPPINSASNQ